MNLWVTGLAAVLALGCGATQERGTVGADGAGASSVRRLSHEVVIDGWVQNPPPPPNLAPLTPAEEAKLVAAIDNTPTIAGYAYSGCHDRAHLLFQALPPELRQRAGKIWLLAPALISLTQDGTVRPTRGPSDIKWTYHVAVAFTASNGEVAVIDPVLTDRKDPVSVTSWLGLLQVPAGSAWTVLSGDYYQFNTYGARGTWKGSLWTIQEGANTCAMPRKGTARDIVGDLLLTDPDLECGLRRFAKDPLNLSWLLERGMTQPFAERGCNALLETYRRQQASWDTLLGACTGSQQSVGAEPPKGTWEALFSAQ